MRGVGDEQRKQLNRGHVGLKYFGEKSWAEITREERHFCLHLYNWIVKVGASEFVRLLRDSYKCDVNPDAEWELAFEACFYRDLRHHRRETLKRYSLKRTFDLALFSNDVIIVIEAKAQQGFSTQQLSDFRKDRDQIKEATGVQQVLMLGLCSSKYRPSEIVKTYFDAEIMRWNELAHHFGSDPNLQRADDVFGSSTAR